jgi:hypothetical protein
MLAGVKVIDLTSVVIGPLCTQILADHGAEVIKVESPAGDIGRHLGGRGRTPGMAPKFLHLNRNKRSICLDLKHPGGHAALMRLLETADVMTWNVRPASMGRMKLGYEDVCRANPKIIYCGMFGFGQTGRYAEVPAYDPIIQGSAGVAGLYEKAFGEPRYVPYVIEPAAGLTRSFMAFLVDSYCEDEAPNAKGGVDKRTVLRLDPRLAPVKAAVLPLSRHADLSPKARDLAAQLRRHWNVEFDDAGAIGRRYRRQDEIGTPFCVTVDFDTLEDHAVTVRDRDAMTQERVGLDAVVGYLAARLLG